MTIEEKTCHGHNDCLSQSSIPLTFERPHRFLWRLRAAYIHLLWHLKTKGLADTLRLVVIKIAGAEQRLDSTGVVGRNVSKYEEVLNLQPGELVEVKSETEITATLDVNRRHKGLLWMANMRKFCGKQYRVFKRLDTILLESNGQVRKMKNTVLLEGVYCDGVEFNGCDRSCLHYWREAWLKKVNGKQ